MDLKKEIKILYLEDNKEDVFLTQRVLTKSGLQFKMDVVETENDFISSLDNFKPELILSDHSLPGFDSLTAYNLMLEKNPGTPFILLTGSMSEEFAVDCLLAGIDDYILKSNLIRLPSSIERVLSKLKMKLEKETIETLHQKLQESHKQIEIKNKERTDSIYYAKRIQDAFLPHDSQFNEAFHAGFAIYRPLDIVSGDLYWIANTTTSDEKKRHVKIIAAIDCTGHGIPGAFMSLLVSTLLSDTLKDRKINSPADVLAHLNKRLPFILNKNNKEKITDGLDIAICALDNTERIVHFAGANRPLWIVRKNASQYEILSYNGTKASIGSHTPYDQEFINNEIKVEQGDRLFLFTDGITDQFGGAKGKKMGRKKLKNVLLSSAHLEINKQKKILSDFFQEWKGIHEQVDDVLLLGIEIN